MRVAVVAMETPHHRDTEGRRRLERLATHLADAGHEVTVFCAQWWDGQNSRFEPEDVAYRAVTATPTEPSFCLRLPALLAGHNPDVIHALSHPPGIALAAGFGGTLARAPVAVDWFGDEPLPRSRTTGLALRWADRVTVPAQMQRTHLRERGYDGATGIVPESIDMSTVRETEPAEDIDVVYAHPLDESANVESLLLGLAELRDRDWSATVVGDGPERATYEQEVSDLRIDDRVTFVGECDRERRVSIYKGAHTFVQTAVREQFATELLWAMACGCLGIVEYQAESSAHELVEQRERAFRVTNPQEIADTIVESADHERRDIDDSFAEFDHDAVRGRYEAIYDELVAEHGLW
ncbi:glycosyltransferase family 4 protein [Haloarcula halophila]|uniref:glycosyltransferase family 4 protein n=1 Tax=Haloarcula TaxID=2237 RepID=UPI0023E38E28|nr:glycosyltransferase [Halomicroarcula sp. DFY41]